MNWVNSNSVDGTRNTVDQNLTEVVVEVVWYPKVNFEIVTRVTPDL